MAIIHRAYTFNPALFHSELSNAIDYDGYLHKSRLKELAQEVLADDSDTINKALKDIRFDDEWFDTSDDSISWTTYWYMIYLISKLSVAPSLSNRSPVSWNTLTLVLPFLGWHEDEISTLCRGNQLNTLVEESNNPRFIDEFKCINQFGGWLNLFTIEKLTKRLLTSIESLTYPNPEMVKAVNGLALLWSQKSIEMIQQAFADATEMLQTANKRKESIFIILD